MLTERGRGDGNVSLAKRQKLLSTRCMYEPPLRSIASLSALTSARKKETHTTNAFEWLHKHNFNNFFVPLFLWKKHNAVPFQYNMLARNNCRSGWSGKWCGWSKKYFLYTQHCILCILKQQRASCRLGKIFFIIASNSLDRWFLVHQ